MNGIDYFKYDMREDCPTGYRAVTREKRFVFTVEQRANYEAARKEMYLRLERRERLKPRTL